MNQKILNDLFEYNPETGLVTNRFFRHYKATKGARAGSATGHGYRRIIIDSVKCYEHHVIWCMIHGYWPKEIDHINGNRSDNRLANLRVATRDQNCYNADRETGASGLKGAYLDKRTTRWYSHIQLGGQVKHLGMFDTPEEAHQAFMDAVELHHGEFAFHKRDAA